MEGPLFCSDMLHLHSSFWRKDTTDLPPAGAPERHLWCHRAWFKEHFLVSVEKGEGRVRADDLPRIGQEKGILKGGNLACPPHDATHKVMEPAE